MFPAINGNAEGRAMTLTEQQLTFFETFGFLKFPGLVADKIDEITAEFTELFISRGGGHAGRPHDGSARSCIAAFIDQRERLSTLIDDPNILGIAKGLMGDDFNYTGSDGNYYSGDTGWHSDGWNPDLLNIKFAFYLDPLTRETGALRVIPGSHRIGDSYSQRLQEQTGRSQTMWGCDGPEVPALALETQPGDVLCFNHNLKHAAFGGGGWRRMFTINCSQRYPEERLEDLRNLIAGGARFWVDRAYGEAMMNTAGPERMRHLEQIMANDSHLAELSRKARETMSEPSRG